MDEHRAVEDAARRFFAAIAAPDVDASALATGPVAERLRLTQAVTYDAELRSFRVTIRHLSVERIASDRAEVSVDAVATVEQFHPSLGARSDAWRYEGPVILRRVRDDWKVADYRVGGRSAAESYVPLDLERQNLDDVFVTARAAALAGGETSVYVEIETRGKTGLELRWGALRRPGRHVLRYAITGPSTSAIPTTAVRVVNLAWGESIPPTTNRLDVLLHAVSTATKKRLTYEFELPLVKDSGSSGSVRAARRVPFALRVQVLLRCYWFLAAVTGLALYLFFAGQPPLAGALLIALGGTFWWSVFRRRQNRVAIANFRATAAIATAMAAVGIAIVAFAWPEDPRQFDSGTYSTAATRNCLEENGLVVRRDERAFPVSGGTLAVRVPEAEIFLAFGSDETEAKEHEKFLERLDSYVPPGVDDSETWRAGNVVYWWGGSREPSDD